VLVRNGFFDGFRDRGLPRCLPLRCSSFSNSCLCHAASTSGSNLAAVSMRTDCGLAMTLGLPSSRKSIWPSSRGPSGEKRSWSPVDRRPYVATASRRGLRAGGRVSRAAREAADAAGEDRRDLIEAVFGPEEGRVVRLHGSSRWKLPTATYAARPARCLAGIRTNAISLYPRERKNDEGLLTRLDSRGVEGESFCERRLGSGRNPLGYVRTPNDLSKSEAETGYQREGRNPGKHRGKRKQPGERSPAVGVYPLVVSARGESA